MKISFRVGAQGLRPGLSGQKPGHSCDDPGRIAIRPYIMPGTEVFLDQARRPTEYQRTKGKNFLSFFLRETIVKRCTLPPHLL
jgi:hypothetical protein